jgi:predicted AAA+ superfamily ATPase
MRGGANLLAGRAITRRLDAFCWKELGASFDLAQALAWGCLPSVYNEPAAAADILDAYVNTYLNEEVKQEGLVRKLAPFMRFLGIAGRLNGQVVNTGGVARDAAVPQSSVSGYFSILEETLFGRLLPAYRPRAKIRETAHPKFYWFDPGVARAVAGLLRDPLEGVWMGYALETLLLHELSVYNHVSGRMRQIFFYRTAAGSEIDFIVETARPQFEAKPHVVCVEAKLSKTWNPSWERASRSLAATEGVVVDRMVGVYTGAHALTRNGFEVLPVPVFLERLYAGGIF